MEVVIPTQDDCSCCDGGVLPEDVRRAIVALAAGYPLTVRTLSTGSDGGSAMAPAASVLFPPGVFLDNQLVSYGRLSERRFRHRVELRLKHQGALDPKGH